MSRNSITVRHEKKQMLEALAKSLGIVTIAAKMVGIDRETHYRWMRKDPEYVKQVEAIGDLVLDFAESQLHKRIKDGDTVATIFYLKTKGKMRGYIERQEIDSRTLALQQTTIKVVRGGNLIDP